MSRVFACALALANAGAIGGSFPAAAQQGQDAFVALDGALTKQFEIVKCAPSAKQSCRMAAIVITPQAAGSICLGEVIATEDYREPGQPSFKAIEVILEITAPSGQLGRAFYKALVPVAGRAANVCLPNQIAAGGFQYTLSVWNDQVASAANEMVPVDDVSNFTARLGQVRGGEAKGIFRAFFGPSYGGNSISVLVTSTSEARSVRTPDGSTRKTDTSFRISENALGSVLVSIQKRWVPLVTCTLSSERWRWNRRYRC